MVSAVRQTFTSPTLTPPKPTTPRQAEPTSCSSATAPPPPVEDIQVEETDISAEELEKRIGEWKEIALFLRRNVVQGEKGEDGSYRTFSLLSVEQGGTDGQVLELLQTLNWAIMKVSKSHPSYPPHHFQTVIDVEGGQVQLQHQH